ncbi:MAG: 3-deoxy-manno-octulosonate cytidylyltransferase [Helicobacter sp.]|nr:3-deoxy-manno-octulosonate cytidylyltransferase [Helicobacter sp.]
MVIIPARLSSTRFAQKVLCPIMGIPMVVLVAQRALQVDDVVVAADDAQIVQACKRYNIRAILTKKTHLSGTDRLAEATEILGLGDNEIVVNVQGDEPFIEPEIIHAVRNLLAQTPSASIASAFRTIDSTQAQDANFVKVVVDKDGFALYFSRSPIPYGAETYYGHLGIYAYRVSFLRHFCTLAAAPLEKVERLEQLRALYYGAKIAMVKVQSDSFGIDTEEDLQRALQLQQKESR